MRKAPEQNSSVEDLAIRNLLLTKVIFSFVKLGSSFISTSDVMTPSRVPNWESIPRVNSMRKKRTAQSWAPGNWLIASVKIINASPVPEALLDNSSWRLHFSELMLRSKHFSYVAVALKPIIEKTTTPANLCVMKIENPWKVRVIHCNIHTSMFHNW